MFTYKNDLFNSFNKGTKMWGAQTWGATTWGRSNRIPLMPVLPSRKKLEIEADASAADNPS